jgi:hypothetical protein
MISSSAWKLSLWEKYSILLTPSIPSTPSIKLTTLNHTRKPYLDFKEFDDIFSTLIPQYSIVFQQLAEKYTVEEDDDESIYK